MQATRLVFNARLLTEAGRPIGEKWGTEAHEPVFRAEYAQLLLDGEEKWELIVVFLPDPRIHGQWLYDHKLVVYAQTRLAVDQLIGRWRRKRRMKVGRRKFKMVVMGK